jgi:hypothetical protein
MAKLNFYTLARAWFRFFVDRIILGGFVHYFSRFSLMRFSLFLVGANVDLSHMKILYVLNIINYSNSELE